ncbi:uncharacterized protein F5Z01DRAFT_633201 [Emericellopsis atlantica]|uniref:Uncharacterized protein n=1 Tax=Emericellopsis atlantica TaxID=2614577 RepID=A0A9P7ZUU0_9HYPO|nr:uncharacterized protein F5Z01DRAFT_633201 [Emericellopsis atlantica]KAG9258201.1 hypothetical protein F5Z01DRAFT_633201 [Emericellopsis atlantica]
MAPPRRPPRTIEDILSEATDREVRMILKGLCLDNSNLLRADEQFDWLIAERPFNPKTCVQCDSTFIERDNGPRSCRYHPVVSMSWSGETKAHNILDGPIQNHDSYVWDDMHWLQQESYATDLEFASSYPDGYDHGCCERPYLQGRGCKRGRHRARRRYTSVLASDESIDSDGSIKILSDDDIDSDDDSGSDSDDGSGSDSEDDEDSHGFEDPGNEKSDVSNGTDGNGIETTKSEGSPSALKRKRGSATPADEKGDDANDCKSEDVDDSLDAALLRHKRTCTNPKSCQGEVVQT